MSVQPTIEVRKSRIRSDSMRVQDLPVAALIILPILLAIIETDVDLDRDI